MRFVTKFAIALVLPAFVPAEPFPPLVTITYGADAAGGWQPCSKPRVVDGDTLRCGSERIRLLGIDAPELSRCPPQRKCVSGDPLASTLSLAQAIDAGPVSYRIIKRDGYNRAVAVVTAGSVNLSCWQISQGQAEYVARWDDGGIIARSCR